MAISFNGIAYGAVVVAGVTLFSIGRPDERAQQMALAAPAIEVGQAAAVPSVAAGGGVTLHSVRIDLPDSDRAFPGGAAADAINNNCLACHSAGMVLTQPALSRAAWQAEVDKMRASYKAPVAPEDVPAIVDYLANLNSGR
jgi:cytochrome c5